jgi:hypothetical protein
MSIIVFLLYKYVLCEFVYVSKIYMRNTKKWIDSTRSLNLTYKQEQQATTSNYKQLQTTSSYYKQQKQEHLAEAIHTPSIHLHF